MSVLGALLLFMGWFGFNGGSTLTLDASVARIVANTALAASFGAFAHWPSAGPFASARTRSW
jgi:Amt family ammonium transporter